MSRGRRGAAIGAGSSVIRRATSGGLPFGLGPRRYRELAVELGGGGAIDGGRFGFGFKAPELALLSVDDDLGSPPSFAPVPGAPSNAAIAIVLRRGAVPQVLPGVAVAIAISMINDALRPFARHIQDRKALGRLRSAVDTDEAIAGLADRPCNVAHAHTRTAISFPAEDAGLGIIGQNLTEALARQIAAAHGASTGASPGASAEKAV